MTQCGYIVLQAKWSIFYFDSKSPPFVFIKNSLVILLTKLLLITINTEIFI